MTANSIADNRINSKRDASEELFSQLLEKELYKLSQHRVLDVLWLTTGVLLGSIILAFVRYPSAAMIQMTIKFVNLGIIWGVFAICKKKKFNAIIVAHLCLGSLTLNNAVFLSYLPLEKLQYYFLAYSLVYLVFSWIVLWRLYHSVPHLVLAFTLLAVFLFGKTSYSTYEILASGALLFTTIAIISTFLSYITYKLAKRELTARIIIHHSNKKLQQQQQEINASNEQLISKEANLRAIVENKDIAIWQINRDYELIEYNQLFNKSFKNLFGVDLMPGMNMVSLEIVEKYNTQWKIFYDKALLGEDARYTTLFFYPKIQKNVALEIVFYPIWRDKQIIGVSIFSKNITNQLETEEKIRNNEELLSSINQNIQEGIYRSSSDGKMIYVNLSFAKMFGYESVEAALAVSPIDFYHNPADRQKFYNNPEQKETTQEVFFKRKDGSTFWGLESCSIAKKEDGIIVFDGAIRDISESKEVRKQMENQNEELLKINTELDRFVYSASHDLKAPLASIMGLITISKLEKDPIVISQYLDMINTSVHKLDRFIKDIISYSRNSRLELEHNLIDFQQLIRDTFNDLEYLDNSRKIDKRIFISIETPFYTDLSRLSVLMNNLVSNAVIYSNPNQQTPFIEIRVSAKANNVVIEVKDNGQGIPEEHQKNIFKMFYRASHTSRGSGLGLYIVKETIEKLKGNITVHSEMGVGSLFTIEIPNLKF